MNDAELVLLHGYPVQEIPFSREEYRGRLERIRKVMVRESVDMLYLTSPEAICYVSGYGSAWYQAEGYLPWSGVAIHVDHDDFIFFEAAGHIALVRCYTVADDVRLYGGPQDADAAFAFVAGELASSGWTGGTVGLEMGSYRPNRRVSERCQAALEAKGCAVVDGTEIVREVRGFKSPAEMACVEKAARIADIGLEAARETLREGITELELWGEVTAAMTRAGGENQAIPMLVTSGVKAVTGHGLASRKQIAAGEVVFLDVCGVFNRYHVDQARSFSIGEPHPDAVERINLSAGVYRAIEEILRPNLPVHELNDTIVRYYKDVGIYENRGWIGGYELGIAFPPDWVGDFHYDADTLHDDDQVFAPGRVVNHESQFYLPHLEGYSILIDTMAFTETQARWLGRVQHELIVA